MTGTIFRQNKILSRYFHTKPVCRKNVDSYNIKISITSEANSNPEQLIKTKKYRNNKLRCNLL